MTLQASCTEIIRSIAEKHGIQAADLTGPSRSKQLWAARREAVVAMREAKVSIGRIAYALKRGKTTIAYYLNPEQDCARSKKSYAAKNGKSVRLNPDIVQLISAYAGGEGIGIDVAANALLRDALGGRTSGTQA